MSKPSYWTGFTGTSILALIVSVVGMALMPRDAVLFAILFAVISGFQRVEAVIKHYLDTEGQ